MENLKSTTWKTIPATAASLRITNPIRDIVDKLQEKNPNKEVISLSIGDPTVFGNFKNPDNVNQKLSENIASRAYNGYAHSAGYPAARKTLAKKFSLPNCQITENDVVISSGASHAIELAVGVLCPEGSNLLCPSPGFSLYQTMCDYKGVVYRGYKLNPKKGWEVDLEHLESQIDDKTAAILVNNPSNPCGSVYTKEHLLDILKVAEKHHIPIISDEIYAEMLFEGHEFHSIASLTDSVPVLAVGGMAKQFLVPGWRIGWVLVYDRHNLFSEIKVGLVKLSQIILGANTLVQSVLEEAIFHTPQSFYDDTNKQLYTNACYLVDRLSKIKGLHPIKPGGAMYLMFEVDVNVLDFQDDVDFARKLMKEESVAVLPGSIFKSPNFIRLVVCPPINKLTEAADRIEEFCKRHFKQ